MAEKEYIERGALIAEYDRVHVGTPGGARKLMVDAPAADVVEVVHGKWNEDEHPFCNVCMECGLVIDRTCTKLNSGKLNYCPNCGAKMDGERKEETT